MKETPVGRSTYRGFVISKVLREVCERAPTSNAIARSGPLNIWQISIQGRTYLAKFLRLRGADNLPLFLPQSHGKSLLFQRMLHHGKMTLSL